MSSQQTRVGTFFLCSLLLLLFLTSLSILDQKMHFLSHDCRDKEMDGFQSIPENLAPERIENVLKEMEITSSLVVTTHQQVLWWRGFYLTILTGVLGYYFYFNHIRAGNPVPVEYIYALILVLLIIFASNEFMNQTWQTQKLNRLCFLDTVVNKNIIGDGFGMPNMQIFIFRESIFFGTLLSPSFWWFYLVLNLSVFLFLGWIEGNRDWKSVFSNCIPIFMVVLIIFILLNVRFELSSGIVTFISLFVGGIIGYWRYVLSKYNEFARKALNDFTKIFLEDKLRKKDVQKLSNLLMTLATFNNTNAWVETKKIMNQMLGIGCDDHNWMYKPKTPRYFGELTSISEAIREDNNLKSICRFLPILQYFMQDNQPKEWLDLTLELLRIYFGSPFYQIPKCMPLLKKYVFFVRQARKCSFEYDLADKRFNEFLRRHFIRKNDEDVKDFFSKLPEEIFHEIETYLHSEEFFRDLSDQDLPKGEVSLKTIEDFFLEQREKIVDGLRDHLEENCRFDEAQEILEHLENSIIIEKSTIRSILSRELGWKILEKLERGLPMKSVELKKVSGFRGAKFRKRIGILRRLRLIEESEEGYRITKHGERLLEYVRKSNTTNQA